MTSKFRAVAYFEAVTYLVLLGATLVKRGFDGPDAVSVLGPIHGIAFIVYVILALKVRPSQGWSLGRLLLVILLSAIPLGGFFVGRDLLDETPATA